MKNKENQKLKNKKFKVVGKIETTKVEKVHVDIEVQKENTVEAEVQKEKAGQPEVQKEKEVKVEVQKEKVPKFIQSKVEVR